MATVHELTATVLAPAYALSAADGQIGGGAQGVFFDDLRLLSTAILRVGGIEVRALMALPEGTGRTRFLGIVPGLDNDDEDPTLRLDRLRIVTGDGMREEIRLRSSADGPVHTAITIDLASDLLPVSVAKGDGARPALAPRLHARAVSWTDGAVTVTASAEQAHIDADGPRLCWQLDLPPGGEVTLHWELHVAGRTPLLVTPGRPVEWSRPGVRADEPRLARLLVQALDDLAGLRLAEPSDPDGTFLGAGVPWYVTLFGRDSLWAARMMLPLGTGLAEGTLRVLARRQGVRQDETTGEAPGKILHELRRHDIQQASPAALPPTYYGTVDATLLWIRLLADAWRWGMPSRVVEELWPNLERALSWLDLQGDPDGDGFVKYIDHSGRGLSNQGWKDSGRSMRFHDGALARPPIALCEVQGYAHRAALDAAELLDAFMMPGANRWRAYADQLAERFRQRFWVPGPLGPAPALAIDGDGRAVDSLTSNVGHLLGTGLLSPDEETTVAKLLVHPSISGGYGLRTMSRLDAGYAPLSYHCGSVWPHDTAITLLGLAEAGAAEAATTLILGLLTAAEGFDYRLPELYAGDGRDEAARPIPYPAACRPQAWSAAAAVAILQAVLGLTANVPRGEVAVRPISALGGLAVENLRIAGHSVHIAVDRTGDVVVTGLPESLSWVDRRRARDHVSTLRVPAQATPAASGAAAKPSG